MEIDDDVPEHATVLHMQRRMFLAQGGDGAESASHEVVLPCGPAAASAAGGGTLGSILFQPIAGDATLAATDQVIDSGGSVLRGVQFGILDAETIQRLSVVTVTNPACKEQPGCLSDLRMGASSVTGRACESCRQDHHHCPGHLGRIQLPHPVLNPLFVTLVSAVLQTVCVHCHRLRLSPWYVATQLPRATPKTTVNGHLNRLKAIHALCGRQQFCQFCQSQLLAFVRVGAGGMGGEGEGSEGLPLLPIRPHPAANRWAWASTRGPSPSPRGARTGCSSRPRPSSRPSCRCPTATSRCSASSGPPTIPATSCSPSSPSCPPSRAPRCGRCPGAGGSGWLAVAGLQKIYRFW